MIACAFELEQPPHPMPHLTLHSPHHTALPICPMLLRPQPRWMGLVLCPNTALCHQVVRLVSRLQDTSGRPVLTACHVSSSSPPPFESPDIVVTTPGVSVGPRPMNHAFMWGSGVLFQCSIAVPGCPPRFSVQCSLPEGVA